MVLDSSLLKLTQDIIGCRRCFESQTFVGGRTVLSAEWAPPRGWAGAGAIPADVVLVAQNPGSPLTGEMAHYESHGLTKARITISADEARAVNEYCLRQYRSPQRGRDWIFHRKSVALARALLWLIDGADPGPSPWTRCWFTDIFKCSTRSESGPQIKNAAFEACRSHFERELDILKPKLLVALGNPADQRLRAAGLSFIKFRHPSNGCPKLDDKYHDLAFEQAARCLGVPLPSNFREARRQVHQDAMAM